VPLDILARESTRGLVAAVTVSVAVACAGAGTADTAVARDYAVSLVGPVDTNGARLHRSAVVGKPFYVRMQLSTDAAAAASVTYDIDLPTGLEVRSPVRLGNGAVTSGCLRSCSVGWNAARARTLAIYYALLPPGPGAFVLQSTIASTDRADSRPRDNTATITIVVVAARLSLGPPMLDSSRPLAGRRFSVTVPVRRSGVPVRPDHAVCRAVVGDRSVAGTASLTHAAVVCTWRIPRGTAGRTLRTTVRARAGVLSAARSWLYSIGP